MSVSLSGLLPVRNVQANIESGVVKLLETLAELTRPVELIVVDDGSTDATIEVLSELPAKYPQIKVLRFGQSRGWAECIRAGLAESTGAILFFEEPGSLLPWEQLALLWSLALKYPVVIGRPAGAGWQAGRLWAPRPEEQDGRFASSGAYQLVRRATLLRVAGRLRDGLSFRQVLLQEGIAWQERILSARTRRAQEILYPTAWLPESLPSRTDQAQPQTSPPNYLLHRAEEKAARFSP